MTQQRANRRQRRQGTPDKSGPSQPATPTRLEVRYIKSAQSRVVHADGAYGGPTPHGSIYMALFSEHQQVPEAIRFDVDAKTRTARPADNPEPPRLVREVEVEVIMSLDLAKSLREWLDDKIANLESPREQDVIRVIESSTTEAQR